MNIDPPGHGAADILDRGWLADTGGMIVDQVLLKLLDLIVIQHSVDTQGRPVPDWLEVSVDERKIVVNARPRRDQIDTDINEQLIVELYSK